MPPEAQGESSGLPQATPKGSIYPGLLLELLEGQRLVRNRLLLSLDIL